VTVEMGEYDPVIDTSTHRHISVDAASGLTHTVVVTAGNIGDVT
jgi:hypothetical protein